jgi:glycerol-3-phosphate dehydrogenase (NAD(P)+)
MKITIVGAGAWGTALACLLKKNQHDVLLWGHNPEGVKKACGDRKSERLPGVELPEGLEFASDLEKALMDSEVAVIAIPSKAFREVSARLKDFRGIAVTVTKGIEYDSGLTMSGVLEQTMPLARVAALSGPTLALEVAREIPAAAVVANLDEALAKQVQELFLRPTFRVYTSTDLVGVELGGALKNVIAIAAGVGDGLGFGDNSKAGLITRSIVEIRRLGVARGAQAETFAGLSGLGDLTVTCFSKLSRNRGFGERIGRGEPVAHVLSTSTSVAEGYPTARSAFQLSRALKVKTPIIDEVYAMLYQGKSIERAIRDLMGRHLKSEDE